MITVHIENRSQLAAAHWNELNKRQLLYISKIIFKRGMIERHQKIAALMVLLFYNFKNFNLKFYIKFIRLPIFAMGSALKATDFLWKGNDISKFIIKKFSHRFRTYHSPDDLFGNLTIHEFAFADTFYERWKKYLKINDLDHLVAILYRVKDREIDSSSEHYKGDIRTPFNEHHIPKNVKRLKSLPDRYKYAILLQYEGNRNQFIQTFEHCFSKSEKRSGKIEGWGKTIMMMAGGLQNLKQTNEVNIYSFFQQLTINVDRSKQAQK